MVAVLLEAARGANDASDRAALKRAAASLFWPFSSGRPPIDDAEALDQTRRLEHLRLSVAIRTVGNAIGASETDRRRWRKKIGSKPITPSTVFPAEHSRQPLFYAQLRRRRSAS
jgi:hypothetical protein